MLSIGVKLRSEREKQKRSLSELATTTCISAFYLEAIEADNVQALPGYFFYKSFVKQYASSLGINYETLADGVNRMAPEEDSDPLPALSTSYQVPKRADSRNLFQKHPRAFSMTAVVAVMLSGSAVYSWWHTKQVRAEEAQLTAGSVTQPVQVARAVPVSAVTPAPEPEKTATQAPSAETVQPSTEADPFVNTPSRVSLNLSAKEKTWVSLRSEGKTVFSGMLAPSESRSVEVSENASLTTGNAAGLEVTYNGKPLGPLGPRGQVRTVVFAQGSAQIVPGRRL